MEFAKRPSGFFVDLIDDLIRDDQDDRLVTSAVWNAVGKNTSDSAGPNAAIRYLATLLAMHALPNTRGEAVLVTQSQAPILRFLFAGVGHRLIVISLCRKPIHLNRANRHEHRNLFP